VENQFPINQSERVFPEGLFPIGLSTNDERQVQEYPLASSPSRKVFFVKVCAFSWRPASLVPQEGAGVAVETNNHANDNFKMGVQWT
jgi:hypothetical protein